MLLTGSAQLAAAQLDGLGSNDRGDKVLLSNTAQVLVDMAGYLISEAQKNLNKSGAEATGELESSIKASDIDVQGKRMTIDISLLDRYKFTDAGVNGIDKHRGSEYSFKTPRPSKKMVTAIEKWLKVRSRRVVKYSSYTENSNNEPKDKIVFKNDPKSAAYAVAYTVKKMGIERTLFFTKAITSTEKEYKKQVAKGFKMDIINSLK